LLDNCHQNTLQISQHLAGWNAHYGEPGALKHHVAHFVAGRPVTTIVRFAVDFDAKPGLQTGKIKRGGIKGKLLPELEPARPLFEVSP